jgi:hypothetical protein
MVVGVGRCTRQTIRKKKGNFVRKNDFSSDNSKPIESVSGTINHEISGVKNKSYKESNQNLNDPKPFKTISIELHKMEDGVCEGINLDPNDSIVIETIGTESGEKKTEQKQYQNKENDSDTDSLEEEQVAKKIASSKKDDDKIIQFTIKTAFIQAINPIDLNEWNEANYFSKLMQAIKSPVIFILKLTIPLVDYDAKNHNWNKASMIINCLLAPFVIVFLFES